MRIYARMLRRLAELTEPRAIDVYERDVSRLAECEIRERYQNQHTQGSKAEAKFDLFWAVRKAVTNSSNEESPTISKHVIVFQT